MVLPPCLLKLCVSAKFLPLRVISLPYNMRTNDMGACQLAFLALLNGFSASRWGCWQLSTPPMDSGFYKLIINKQKLYGKMRNSAVWS